MLGPGSIYRALVPVWRKFIRPTRDERAMPGTRSTPSKLIDEPAIGRDRSAG
jgi:hypothetical protein